MNCETAYHKTGEPRAGVLAARALAELGRKDDIRGWVDHLGGGSEEAEVLEILGDAQFKAGELEQAEETFRRELALRESSGDSAAVAKTAYKLAFLALRRSDYRTVLNQIDLAYSAALAAGDPLVAAQSLGILYSTLSEIGDLSGAERILEEASRLATDTSSTHRFLVGRGSIQLQRGRPRIAIGLFRQILDDPETPEPRTLQAAHLNLTEALLLVGDVPGARRSISAAWESAGGRTTDPSLLLALRGKVATAEERFDEALEDLELAAGKATGSNLLWEIHFERGRALESSGRASQAEAAYLEAIEIIEEARRRVGADDFKEWLLAKRRRPYERLFRLQAERGSPLEALATAERIKARTLVEAFLRASSPTEAEASTGDTRAALARGRDRLDHLSELLPALRESPLITERSISSLLQTVVDHHVLVFLEVEEDELWRIEIRSGQAAVKKLAKTSTEVGSLIDRLVSRPADRMLASRLGEILLEATALPDHDKPIHVITDGKLGDLPFALLRWDDHYLVERYVLAYAPSLAGLAVSLETPWRGNDAAIIVADPRGDLPQATAEAREIAALLSTEKLFTGPEATSRILTSNRSPRLLHLATHTSFGPKGPVLVLADRSLSPADLLAEPVGPAIVVLASCASASRSGKGLWGSIAGAFLAGGSRVAIASLWSVEDQTARRFVSRLYREGVLEDPARALAKAQRSLISDGKGAEHWAPFVLMGSARALPPTQRTGGDK